MLHELFYASLDAAAIENIILSFAMTESKERADFVVQKWRTYEKESEKQHSLILEHLSLQLD